MNEFLPGFEPDAAERAQLRFVGGVLDLRQFDKILISVSGGKDSHAMLWLVCDLADRQGVPRDRLREALEKIAQWDMLARSQKGLIAIIDVLKDAARKALEGVENVEKDS